MAATTAAVNSDSSASSSATARSSSSPRRRRPGRSNKRDGTKTERTFSPDRRPWAERTLLYQYMPFRGMWHDLRRRAPFYVSDWTEGFQPRNLERVIGATIKMFFLNIFPALAYIVDMNIRTEGNYGVNEGILASAIAAITFAIFSVQPLTIVGVTGLINLFNYTTFDIINNTGIDYLQFQAWALIWAAIMHWIVAIFNISDFTRFITDCTSETFGLYVGIVYIQKGVELIIEEFTVRGQGGFFAVMIAMLFALAVYFMERTAGLQFGPFWLRKFVMDYAFALAIVFFTGFVHIPGYIKEADPEFLPITKSFAPTLPRNWVVPFWELPVKWVFVSLPFGFLVLLLFYFDNNVSSLMAQARHFPVKRPSGFHWDFFLLGCTTFVAGILGLPAPNGLVPQAPVHTESLCVTKMVPEDTELTENGFLDEKQAMLERERSRDSQPVHEHERKTMKVVRTRLVEQRVSHLVMGLLCLGTMSRPLLVVLGLMSIAMFSGVFIVVGWGSVEGNGIIHKVLYLLRDPALTTRDHPFLKIKRRSIAKFAIIQLVFVAAMMAVSESIAGISFPIIIILLIPVRYYLFPKIFTLEELAVLDAPTANSDAVLVSLGGPLLPEHGQDPTEAVKDIRRRAGLDEETGRDVRRRQHRDMRLEEGGVREVEGGSGGVQRVASIRR